MSSDASFEHSILESSNARYLLVRTVDKNDSYPSARSAENAMKLRQTVDRASTLAQFVRPGMFDAAVAHECSHDRYGPQNDVGASSSLLRPIRLHHHLPGQDNKMRATAIALASSLCLVSAAASAAPVNLTTWTAESYPAVAGFNPGVWTVAGGGATVTQSVNGQPTLFVGDFSAFGTQITGKIRPGNDGDDDYIGFALGFKPGDATNAAADYLLIDWKQGTQGFDFGAPSLSPGGTAQAGLAVSRVTGIPDADEFWQHANLAGTPATSGLTELARGATLGNVGWVDNTEYTFTFDFGPNDLEVFVNGVKQLDITGSFGDGRMAFYNFSQSSVLYSAFERETGSFPPPNGTVPEPGTLSLLGLALAAAGYCRRKKV